MCSSDFWKFGNMIPWDWVADSEQEPASLELPVDPCLVSLFTSLVESTRSTIPAMCLKSSRGKRWHVLTSSISVTQHTNVSNLIHWPPENPLLGTPRLGEGRVRFHTCRSLRMKAIRPKERFYPDYTRKLQEVGMSLGAEVRGSRDVFTRDMLLCRCLN